MNRNRQIQFIDRLSSLIDSGISMEEALTIIINMESIHKIRKIIIEIREKVRKGISLSNSMHSSYKSFDPILLSMISYGEYSGALSLSIKQAKDILEKSKNIKKKIIGALIYPSFIAFATIAMTIFLVIYIFPKIMPLFIGMNIKLPLLTRFVRKIYEYSIHYGLWISILFAIMFGVGHIPALRLHKSFFGILIFTASILSSFLFPYLILTYKYGFVYTYIALVILYKYRYSFLDNRKYQNKTKIKVFTNNFITPTNY